MNKISIKKISIPEDSWSMITIIAKGKKKGLLYHDGVLLGKVKSYNKTAKWFLNNYYIYNLLMPSDGRSISGWVKDKGQIKQLYIYSRPLTENEIESLYEYRFNK